MQLSLRSINSPSSDDDIGHAPYQGQDGSNTVSTGVSLDGIQTRQLWTDYSGRIFVGTHADEVIKGSCANDELYGGRGNDWLIGGAGNDVISGNQGCDYLTGGKGADTFLFDGDFDREVVRDFCVHDGDKLAFIFYPPDQEVMTAADVIAGFEQVGCHAVFKLPGTDEEIILKNIDIDDLREDMIDVTTYLSTGDLLC